MYQSLRLRPWKGVSSNPYGRPPHAEMSLMLHAQKGKATMFLRRGGHSRAENDENREQAAGSADVVCHPTGGRYESVTFNAVPE